MQLGAKRVALTGLNYPELRLIILRIHIFNCLFDLLENYRGEYK